jgi:hypothetical protein
MCCRLQELFPEVVKALDSRSGRGETRIVVL